MDPKILLDRLDQKERSIVRLGRKLGRARFWLNGVEAKLGMKVSDFLKLDKPHADTEKAKVEALREAWLAAGDSRQESIDEPHADTKEAPVAGKDYIPFGMVEEAAYNWMVAERDEAVEHHKTAHKVAMGLHGIINAAVDVLQGSLENGGVDDRDTDAGQVMGPAIREAISLLTSDEAGAPLPAEDPDAWERLRKERDDLQEKLDDALERCHAMARQRTALREIVGCIEGEELEDRVRDLVEMPKASDNVVSLAAYTTLKESDEAARRRLDKVFELVGGCPDNMEYELEVALRKGREAAEEVRRLSTTPRTFGDVVARSSYEAVLARAEKAETEIATVREANGKMAASMDQAAALLAEIAPMAGSQKLGEALAILTRED